MFHEDHGMMSIKVRALVMVAAWTILFVATFYLTMGSFFWMVASLIIMIYGVLVYVGYLMPSGTANMSEKELTEHYLDKAASIVGAYFILFSYILLLLACFTYAVNYGTELGLSVGTGGGIIMISYFNSKRFKGALSAA